MTKPYNFATGSISAAIETILQPAKNGISNWFFLSDIDDSLPNEFKGKLNGNGSAIFQNDRGMGKKYVIEKEYSEEGTRRLSSVRLAGFSTARQNLRSSIVPPKIRAIVNKEDCCVCGTGSSIECDHKNGRKDTSNDVNEKSLSEYQPLCHHCNKVKREVCKSCTKDSLRFDATRKGFKKGWTVGSKKFQPATVGCTGCYWYDPIQFTKDSYR